MGGGVIVRRAQRVGRSSEVAYHHEAPMSDDNNGPGPIGIILIPFLLGLLAYLLWDAGIIR